MGIAIIPKDKEAMKKFVGKTREWIAGFLDGHRYVTNEIDFKLKDLKKRKPKLFDDISKYAMQMSIEELEEIKRLTDIKSKTKEDK